MPRGMTRQNTRAETEKVYVSTDGMFNPDAKESGGV